MRRFIPVLLLLLFSGPGCIVVEDHSGEPPPRADFAGEPTLALGPQGYPGYRILAGSSASIPDGHLGYIVTANGAGGFIVSWTDTYGSAAEFSGTVTTNGVFDPRQTGGLSGAEELSYTAANQLAFRSRPGRAIDGINLVTTADPIYVEGKIDGTYTLAAIYFTGAATARLVASAYDPVAFTSP